MMILLEMFYNNLKKSAAYKKTYNELNRLTDRELHDIGIFRCDIPRIAEEAMQKS